MIEPVIQSTTRKGKQKMEEMNLLGLLLLHPPSQSTSFNPWLYTPSRHACHYLSPCNLFSTHPFNLLQVLRDFREAEGDILDESRIPGEGFMR